MEPVAIAQNTENRAILERSPRSGHEFSPSILHSAENLHLRLTYFYFVIHYVLAVGAEQSVCSD